MQDTCVAELHSPAEYRRADGEPSHNPSKKLPSGSAFRPDSHARFREGAAARVKEPSRAMTWEGAQRWVEQSSNDCEAHPELRAATRIPPSHRGLEAAVLGKNWCGR